ncbi:MAG: hypothetical protein NT069_20900 [Planctomycetota bacterium]|nr:hypothetical protein [Planctomycetota bacterium]
MNDRQLMAIAVGSVEATEWNQRVPVGTPVKYSPAVGPAVEGVTRSEAWCLGHGKPVVLITGKTGGVALSHLEVMT